MRWTILSISLALALGLGLAASPAGAQFDDPKAAPADAPAGPGNSEIRDPAGIFGREAVRQALARLVTLERTYRVPTTIETIDSLRGEPIDEATQRMARRLGPQGKGVFVLMAREDHKLEVIVSRDYPTLNVRAKRLAIRDAFLDDFRKGEFDQGLRRGVDAIEKVLAASVAPPEQPAARPARAADPAPLPPADPGAKTPATGLLRRDQAKLTLAGARKLIAGAEAKAKESGYKMNIAVVDDGGHLLAFSRMDDARPASAATAITKATTAATFRAPTGPLTGNGTPSSPDVLLNLSLQNAAAASGGKITTLLGGIPVVVEGQVVGAVGCGGGSGEQDAEVARAAVNQFLADLGAATLPAPK